MTKKYLCVHGHFYQPPRENPWLGEIERQQSASPFHDWNDRIHHECYLPNAMSRIYDQHGKILNIINNYEKISFNFGPTLLSWLEHHQPETYEKILEADKNSVTHFKGHGNAIAQVYNHIILPLANERDKKTQVLWGIEDFKTRFKRLPESIWLSETACNEETLEILVEAGMKFLILAPLQAEAVRAFNQKEWQDVSSGNIDPKRPYRCFLKKDPKKYIDIFFYDGPISRAISFEEVLADTHHFAERLETAVDPKRAEPQLIHIATDGETYGHHKTYGDRVLAYLLVHEAAKRGYKVTNYSQFLALHPPTYEVRLKAGDNGEGTSWSCAHGVKRWKEHCGCRGDGPAEWTQHWRKPLREALDWLRDELATCFTEEGQKYFKEVWQTRDHYIQVILNRTDDQLKKFLKTETLRDLNEKEISQSLMLLEMQRYAMLMYTSCGWFFTELSGIETIQILLYAAKAIQLCKMATGKKLEAGFLEKLALAKSNIAEFENGAKIYETLIKPRIVSLHNVASYYAIFSILHNFKANEKRHLYCFHLEVIDRRQENVGGIILNYGKIEVQSNITLEKRSFIFTAAKLAPYDFRCSVKPYTSEKEFEKIENDLFEGLQTKNIIELIRLMDFHFGEKYFDLKDLPLGWRTHILSILTKEAITYIHQTYDHLYEENRRLHEIYSSIHVAIPDEILYIIEETLRRRLETEIKEIAKAHFDLKQTKSLDSLLKTVKVLNIKVKKKSIQALLNQILTSHLQHFTQKPSSALIAECLNLQKIAQKMDIEMDYSMAQNHLFLLLQKWKKQPNLFAQVPSNLLKNTYQFASKIGFNIKEFKK